MSKKPSVETQLRDLKRRFAEMSVSYTVATRASNEFRRLLGEANAKLAACDAERSKLLDAMCAHVKHTPAKPEAAKEPTTFNRWTVGPAKIGAIKALRNANAYDCLSGTSLGLAEAKTIIESGAGHLTAAEKTAISAYVEFVP